MYSSVRWKEEKLLKSFYQFYKDGKSMKTREFGNAVMYVFENVNGMRMEVSDFGATLCALFVPDKDGNLRDVVLGYDEPAGYEGPSRTFFGATVGRNANRIAGGRFLLNGELYQLEQNDHGNNLHSGNDFYSFRIWDVKESGENWITFALHSPDGDQGYPGAVDIEVTYTLTEDNAVQIDYYALPQDDTPINLTNHSYFNLNGHASGDILEQYVWVDADAFTPTDETLIPSGDICPVAETPMDFRVKKTIGRDISCGYDHNWCLNNKGKYAKVAEMYSDLSGIAMEVYTDLPGVQIYTGNYLHQEAGKQGTVYGKHQGICFETQYYPNAVNQETFPSPIVKKGETYRTCTMYKYRLEL